MLIPLTAADEADVIPETALDHLVDQGWTWWQPDLALALVTDLRADCLSEWARREFEPAGIGPVAAHQVDRRIRSDYVHWWEPAGLGAPRLQFRLFVESLQRELNRRLFLALHEIEMHYAVYPPGGFYRRHLDQFRGRNNRQISMVFFLNDAWTEADGGHLRLYSGDLVRDIAPQAGILVLFLSASIEHEVLVTHRQRHSIAGWFKNRSWPLV